MPDVSTTLATESVSVVMGDSVLLDEDVQNVNVKTVPVSALETCKDVKVNPNLSYTHTVQQQQQEYNNNKNQSWTGCSRNTKE